MDTVRAGFTGAIKNTFAARVEDELRSRRDRGVGRCAWCGKQIDAAADYVPIRDRLMHSACTAHGSV